jgi:hypothetical protein
MPWDRERKTSAELPVASSQSSGLGRSQGGKESSVRNSVKVILKKLPNNEKH